MALIKVLFFDDTSGDIVEQNTTDELQAGKITLSGIGGVAIDAGDDKIVNVANPTDPQDAATKYYVDNVAQGLRPKDSVIALADTNQSLSGTLTVDGVGLSDGDRILLTGQTNPVENGIWIVKTSNWERPEDFDTGDSAASAFTFVQKGTNYADTGWVCTTDAPNDIIDTNNLSWAQFSGAGSIVAGAGLTKTGNTIDVGNGAGIKVNADNIEVEILANSGLEFDAGGVSGKLKAKVNTTKGLDMDANGIFVDLAASSGLQFTGGDLDTLLNASGGLQKDASGLAIKIDDTPDTLDVGANGLKVVGLPSLFKVNDVAVGATVTAANLDSLTDGSVITTLHSHSASGGIERTGLAKTGETITAGDPIAWSDTADRLAMGDAGNEPDSRVFGIAIESITDTVAGKFVLPGTVAVGILSGATPGARYYLKNGGGLTTTPVTGSGRRVVLCGFAKNTTDLEVFIQRMVGRS